MNRKLLLALRSESFRAKDLLLIALFLIAPPAAWILMDWSFPIAPVSNDLAKDPASLLQTTRTAYLLEAGTGTAILLLVVTALYFRGGLKKPISLVLAVAACLLSAMLLYLALQMPAKV